MFLIISKGLILMFSLMADISWEKSIVCKKVFLFFVLRDEGVCWKKKPDTAASKIFFEGINISLILNGLYR